MAFQHAANTLFTGDGKEAQLVVNPKAVADKAPINKLFEAAKTGASNVNEFLGLRQTSIRNTLAAAVQVSQLKDKRQMLEAGLALFGSNKARLMETVGGNILDKATGFIGVDPEVMGTVKAVIGEGTYYLTNNDKASVSGLMNMIRTMSGNSELVKMFDLETEAALLASMVESAIEMGLPEIADQIIQLSAPEAWNTTYRYVSEIAVNYGDLTALNASIDKIGADGVLSRTPEAIRRILAAYRLPARPTDAVIAEQYTRLTTTLARINPNWDKYYRNGEWIPDLHIFTQVSADALKVFSSVPDYDYALLGPRFTLSTTQAVSAELYPQSIVSLR